MNCPVCDRSLAPTLSICPTCGAMMNDTVREELQTKITPGINLRIEATPDPMPGRSPLPARPSIAPPPVMKVSPPAKGVDTAGLKVSKTSPTLVEFQNKNASLPDWRIQLQNAVQQRKGGHVEAPAKTTANTGAQFPTNGGAALKAEVVQRVEPQPTAPDISDPRVASALRRIEESRKAFQGTVPGPKKFVAPKPVQARPFGVVANTGAAAATVATGMATAVAPARVIVPPKPTLVSTPQPAPVAEKRDTNKLPPINRIEETIAKVPVPVIERVEKLESGPLPMEFGEIKRIRIKAENTVIESADVPEPYEDEIEDLAPFSMRFGAGLFDLIIAMFTSMVLLSPVAFLGGNWFTAAGMLTLGGTCAVVSLIYMTVCLGFYGKTMGMRLFSLELVDAVENEYPTIKQAAVNSSLFILSLFFGGAGFLTVFFNEEKRAAHDLLSGTILVREF